jgi:4-phytase/acid phosphatase
MLDQFSMQAFPEFSVPPGYLTANGTSVETILGGYYRAWLTDEGLLTGNDAADATGLPRLPVDLGGLPMLESTTSSFFLEYAEGMPLSDVAWGRLTADQIGQLTRITLLLLDLEFRTPYVARVESSNLASHVARSLLQASTGDALAGSVGTPQTKVMVLIASDVNIAGLAGLLHLDWMLPGYQQDFCTLGGALVFELRQSLSTGEYVVRASYVGQSLDQLRNRTALTLSAPPSIAPVFIPGCSTPNARFDCPLSEFVKVADAAIDPKSVDLTH